MANTPAPSGATATAIPCVLPPHGVVISLENPAPFDTLISGTSVVVNGIAYDTRATSGAGVSSVTVYLGSRDAGGMALGNALLGQPNPSAPSGSQLANAGFSLRTPTLPEGSGGRSIFVYAQSSVDSSQGTLEVPVYLNSAPTPVRGQIPTAVLPTPPVCTPTPVPTATAAPTQTPTPAPPTVAPAVAVSPVSSPTPLTINTPAPLVPAAPGPAVGVPSPVAAVPTVAPAAAQATAPRGGGTPAALGFIVVAMGTVIIGGGLALRRRERRSR